MTTVLLNSDSIRCWPDTLTHMTHMLSGWLTTEVVHDFGSNDTKAKASIKQVASMTEPGHADARHSWRIIRASQGSQMIRVRERRCRMAVRTALTTHTLRQNQRRASWMLRSRSTRASSSQPGADDRHRVLQELRCVFPRCVGAGRGCPYVHLQCCAGFQLYMRRTGWLCTIVQVQPWQPAVVTQCNEEGGGFDLHSVCELTAGDAAVHDAAMLRRSADCRILLLHFSCGTDHRCCLLHMQAVKLGVSRKQGDTSWGATYIFPVLVRTEVQSMTLSGVTLQLIQCDHTAMSCSLCNRQCMQPGAKRVMMSMQVAADYKHRDFKVRGAN